MSERPEKPEGPERPERSERPQRSDRQSSKRRSSRRRRVKRKPPSEPVPLIICGWKIETYKATTLLLGLLSFLLLAGVIFQGLILQTRLTKNDRKMKSMREEMMAAVTAKEQAESLSDYYHKQCNDTLRLVKELQAIVTNITEEMKAIKAAIISLKRNNSKLLNEIKELETELESCDCERVEALYNKTLALYVQLQQDYKDLNEEMKNLQANHSRCEMLVAEQASTIRTLRKRLHECLNQLQDLERRLKASEELTHNLTLTNQELEKGLGQCLADYQVLLQQNDSLARQLEAAHREIETLRGTLNLMQQENTKLQSSLAEATAERNKLSEENRNLKVQINKLQKDYDRLNATLESLQNPCGENWTHIEDYCYYLSKFPTNWRNSAFYCRSLQAELVMIKTRAQSESVSKIHCYSVWIGLTRKSENHEWYWLDGTRLGDEFWSESNPSYPTTCAVTWHNRTSHGLWTVNFCQHDQYFICQRSVPSKKTVS